MLCEAQQLQLRYFQKKCRKLIFLHFVLYFTALRLMSIFFAEWVSAPADM